VRAIGCKIAVVIAVLDRLERAAEAFGARGLVFRRF
jgi:orotate phosphoribosyltransferase